MSIRKELINLTIINNSDCSLTIPLFQNNVASINATTKYSWDITTADLSCGFGSIIINSITYNITFDTTLTGLLSSLNGLNFGYFCSEIILGQLYIYTIDDTNIYGDLDLCPTPTTTTTSTSTTSTSTTSTSTTSTSTSTTSTTTTAIPTTTTTSTSTTSTSTSTTSTTTTDIPTTTTTSTTSTTTTATPPPTTTSTTTTTTTLALEWIITVNVASDIDISGMEIGGAAVLAIVGSFPATNSGAVEGVTQTITIPGTYTLTLLSVTGALAGQSITVIDSNGASQNQAISNPFSGNVTFTGVYVDGIVKVQVIGNI